MTKSSETMARVQAIDTLNDIHAHLSVSRTLARQLRAQLISLGLPTDDADALIIALEEVSR